MYTSIFFNVKRWYVGGYPFGLEKGGEEDKEKEEDDDDESRKTVCGQTFLMREREREKETEEERERERDRESMRYIRIRRTCYEK